MGTVNQFPARITSEHSDKPNFMDMVLATCQPAADLINLYTAIPGLYDLDNAEGAQLDVIGQWVGVSRYLSTPLAGVYFAFNTANVGFNQGIWKRRFDPDTGLISLPDDYYRILIRVRILNNHWDGTKASAYNLFNILFTTLGYHFFIEDPADLSIRLGLIGPDVPPALLMALFLEGSLDVKPIGVHISGYLYQTAPGPLFAFNLNSAFFAGFNTGGWANFVEN
jgi:hypothetical protein